jgi:leucyl aminopeptidase
MQEVLRHMTSYYTRYFGSTEGEQSSQWLYDHIAEVTMVHCQQPGDVNAD